MKKYVQSPDILIRQEDEESWILFNPRTATIHSVKELGQVLWSLCEEVQSSESIAKQFTERYTIQDMEDLDIVKRLEHFLDDLVSRDLLRYSK